MPHGLWIMYYGLIIDECPYEYDSDKSDKKITGRFRLINRRIRTDGFSGMISW